MDDDDDWHVAHPVQFSPRRIDGDEDEDEVAAEGGGFQWLPLARAAAPSELSQKRSLPVIATMVLLLAVGLGLSRSTAFWCGARGIPLGTLLREPGFSIDQMPDLSGRTALVTGANSGLGLEVARQLAIANARVVLACRDVAACRAAAQTIQLDAPASAVETVQLDLSDLRSVAACAASLGRRLGSLHILVLNAGVASQFPIDTTIDGLERTFQINYLSHFALTTRLLPLLTRTARQTRRPSRIVHLTSGAHRGAPSEGVPLAVEQINGAMGAYARYGMAKLASLAFSNELARRHRPSILISNAVHPGVVATSMLRRDNFVRMLGQVAGRGAWAAAQIRNALFAYSSTTGALSILYAAAATEIERHSISGELIVPVATRWPAHHRMANDASFGAALWSWSEKQTREALRRRR